MNPKWCKNQGHIGGDFQISTEKGKLVNVYEFNYLLSKLNTSAYERYLGFAKLGTRHAKLVESVIESNWKENKWVVFQYQPNHWWCELRIVGSKFKVNSLCCFCCYW